MIPVYLNKEARQLEQEGDLTQIDYLKEAEEYEKGSPNSGSERSAVRFFAMYLNNLYGNKKVIDEITNYPSGGSRINPGGNSPMNTPSISIKHLKDIMNDLIIDIENDKATLNKDYKEGAKLYKVELFRKLDELI